MEREAAQNPNEDHVDNEGDHAINFMKARCRRTLRYHHPLAHGHDIGRDDAGRESGGPHGVAMPGGDIDTDTDDNGNGYNELPYFGQGARLQFELQGQMARLGVALRKPMVNWRPCP